ncbi:MAG: hypothetical protein SH817_10435 [Leptospira sp.]|nr:hypothetical protein [Leptospira sp.]
MERTFNGIIQAIFTYLIFLLFIENPNPLEWSITQKVFLILIAWISNLFEKHFGYFWEKENREHPFGVGK